MYLKILIFVFLELPHYNYVDSRLDGSILVQLFFTFIWILFWATDMKIISNSNNEFLTFEPIFPNLEK